MNTEQQSQALGKLREIQEEICADIRKDKQVLIAVILEQTDTESCLESLRQILLESQVKNEIRVGNEDSYISEMFPKVHELPTDQLKQLTEAIVRVFEPIMRYRKLLDSIAEIMRSSELTSEIKLDRISDLIL